MERIAINFLRACIYMLVAIAVVVSARKYRPPLAVTASVMLLCIQKVLHSVCWMLIYHIKQLGAAHVDIMFLQRLFCYINLLDYLHLLCIIVLLLALVLHVRKMTKHSRKL